jgi:hypothetical protein
VTRDRDCQGKITVRAAKSRSISRRISQIRPSTKPSVSAPNTSENSNTIAIVGPYALLKKRSHATLTDSIIKRACGGEL